MFKSNRIFTIVSRGGQVARVSYDPKRVRTTKRELVGETDMASNAAVLQTVNFTLGQLIDSGFEGRVSFVVNDDVAIRFFELRRAVREGKDTVAALHKEWMDEEMLASIEEFCIAVESLGEGVELNFVKLSNVHNWALSVEDENFVLEEGMELNFKDGVTEDGAVHAETILNGKYVVAKHGDNFVVPRRGNSMDIINLRKTVEYAWSKCPQEEINFEDGIIAGEEF